ncbi:MAG: hypothetical protein VX642_12850 [Bdellovibrionota bacterium]|nr:hypothetical protein [Bdellovibrionota bacterium]
MAVLDRANFDSSGAIRSEERNAVGQQVLENINRLHYSFFSSREYTLDENPLNRVNRSAFDSSQPSLYFTKALFSKEDLSLAVTGTDTLEAIREDNSPNYPAYNYFDIMNCSIDDLSGNSKATESAALNLFDLAQTKDNSLCSFWVPKVYDSAVGFWTGRDDVSSCSVGSNDLKCYRNQSKFWGDYSNAPIGKLYGVKKHRGMPLPSASMTFVSQADRRISEHKDLSKNMGAGIIGDPVFALYFMANVPGYKADGSVAVPRTWAKAVYEDLLCRELPSLRPYDVSFYQLENGKGASFRNKKNCLQCHASMDQMAGNFRNIQLVTSQFDYANLLSVVSSMRLKTATVSSSETWSDEANSTWHESTPLGRLYYRDYSGKLINKGTSNISDLGQTIAELDDFYICTAKKYYRYFVGVDVDLSDPGMRTSELSEEDKKHREEVIRLGKDLKKYKRLDQLIEGIFESKSYLKLVELEN